MEDIRETEKFGSGELTTIESEAAVDCPRCGDLVFTRLVGDVSCDSCGHDFHAHDHRGESCPGIECGDCGEAVPFSQDHQLEISGFELYRCPQCTSFLVVEADDGPQPLEEVMKTEWILDGRSLEDVGTTFEKERWLTSVRTSREELVTKFLNLEAKATNLGFNPYSPGDTDAYLCFTNEYCVGYITWKWNSENPELGQLFILPAFREQGIGAGFVQAWPDEVAGQGSTFDVNCPNSNMFRLLRSIGAIEVAEDGDIEFLECEVTGHRYDLPDEWAPDS